MLMRYEIPIKTKATFGILTMWSQCSNLDSERIQRNCNFIIHCYNHLSTEMLTGNMNKVKNSNLKGLYTLFLKNQIMGTCIVVCDKTKP